MNMTKILTSARRINIQSVRTYLHGEGGRFENNARKNLKGMTFRSLLRHYELTPLVVVLGFACTIAAAFPIRSAIKGTDVNILKRKDDSVVNRYDHRQYKFINPAGVDYSKYGDRPEF